MKGQKNDLGELIEKGKELRQANQRAEALETFKQAYTQYPKAYKAVSNYTTELLYKEDKRLAKEILNEYQASVGAHFFCSLQLAQLAFNEGEFEKTQYHLDVCHPLGDGINKKNRARLLQGLLLKKIGKLDWAIKEFIILKDNKFKIETCVSNLVVLFLYTARFEELEALVAEHQEMFSSITKLSFHQSNYESSLGNFEASEKILGGIKDDNPQTQNRILLAKGKNYFSQYQHKKSLDNILKVAAKDNIRLSVRLRLAQNYISLGEVDKAYEVLRLATTKLEKSGQAIHPPLKSHAARVINEIKAHPKAYKELLALNEGISTEVDALAQIVKENPFYFGSALYFLNAHFKNHNFQYSEVPSSIPKTIIQYWNQKDVPVAVQKIMDSWKRENPDFEYKLFDRKRAYIFLRKEYDIVIAKRFQKIIEPATQSDLFRLAYLAKFGGVYVDADDFSRKGLNGLLNKKADVILLREDFGAIANNFIACVPGNALIKKTLDAAGNNLAHYNNEGPWFSTGPGLFTCTTAETLVNGDEEEKERTVVVSQEEFRKYIFQHMRLDYKNSADHWLGKSKISY